MRTVRVSMFPDVPCLVDDEEYLDLLRQGLVVEGPQQIPAAAPAPTVPSPTTAVPAGDDPPKRRGEVPRHQGNDSEESSTLT